MILVIQTFEIALLDLKSKIAFLKMSMAMDLAMALKVAETEIMVLSVAETGKMLLQKKQMAMAAK